MLNWIGKYLCLLAAFGVLDGHLLLAQSWAWATMVKERNSTQNIAGALDSTLRGEAPCAKCRAVQQERQKQQQQSPVPELKPCAKFPPALLTGYQALAPPPARHHPLPRVDRDHPLRRVDAPPCPPPWPRLA